jgi:hypothetical protein
MKLLNEDFSGIHGSLRNARTVKLHSLKFGWGKQELHSEIWKKSQFKCGNVVEVTIEMGFMELSCSNVVLIGVYEAFVSTLLIIFVSEC